MSSLGQFGGWIDPGVAPVHPGRGEFENKTMLSSLPALRVRFNTEVEVRTFVAIDEPTVVRETQKGGVGNPTLP